MSDLDLVKQQFPDIPIYDLTQFYSEFVPFTVNSVYPIHRWYRFKEGYSRDLVHLILGSLGIPINSCLDPFGGIGTTALACQEVGIRCYSIEVNPFLYHVARAKLVTEYTVKNFDEALAEVRNILARCKDCRFEEPVMSTITENAGKEKWLFHRPVLQAILALRQSFQEIASCYSDLLLVVLASILAEVGNTDKDGKCVRYKKGWREKKLSREGAYDLFFKRAELFREDIEVIERCKWQIPSNADLCAEGSALNRLKQLSLNSVDAVITSPPYLNSFDYTDVYMPELWALGFVKDYAEVRRLRAATFRSHVQVRWQIDDDHLDDLLKSLVAEVVEGQLALWNEVIPDMIRGYFLDMHEVLTELRRILRPGGKLCIIVGTSSYYKVVIPTDVLIAKLAVELGFEFEEMRVVRKFKRSTKQTTDEGKALPPLRESILILGA